ncbi:MAG: hypothetical protein RIS47_283 [Bacteroidota bacterium]|jgi:hypothetical protein
MGFYKHWAEDIRRFGANTYSRLGKIRKLGYRLIRSVAPSTYDLGTEIQHVQTSQECLLYCVIGVRAKALNETQRAIKQSITKHIFLLAIKVALAHSLFW